MVELAGVRQAACWIKAVDAGVDHKEAVDVPEPQKKLWHAFADGPFAVADAVPRGLAGKEIPTQRISAVPVKNLGRLLVVPLAFRHLAAVLTKHVAEHNAGAEGVRIVLRRHHGRRIGRPGVCCRIGTEQQRADR